MDIDKFNHEGYSDPTTYEALTNIHHEEVVADKKGCLSSVGIYLQSVCRWYRE